MTKRKLSLAVALLVAGMVYAYSGVVGLGRAQTIEPQGDFVKPLPGKGGQPPKFSGPQVMAPVYKLPSAPQTFVNWTLGVMQSYRDGNWEIYRFLGTPYELNLSNNPASDYLPRLNHDLTRVVFTSNRNGNSEIYVMNFDGSSQARLTYNNKADHSPDWSPDGGRIVFISDRDGADDVYLMGADGSNQTRLTSSGENSSPTWSPDGTQIAWVHYIGPFGSLWVMGADGGDQHAITGDLLYLGNPSWSPDGSRLALDLDFDGDLWNELAVINTDGSNLQMVYDPGGTHYDAWMGDWLTNGTRLAFTLAHWNESGGQYYLASTSVQSVSVTQGGAFAHSTSSWDMNPDWVMLDPYAPTSWVDPLPAYSRAAGFVVKWAGVDVGPAGISGYQPQSRLGQGGTWQNLSGEWTTGTFTTFSSDFCDVAYFRTRAFDHADNWEAWPPGAGVKSTRLFYWLLDGWVNDNRGHPLPNAGLAVSPNPWETNLTTGPTSAFQAHLLNTGVHMLDASHSSYLGVQDVPVFVAGDTRVELHLGPNDDILTNGDFESGLNGWTPSGTLSATIGTGYSGANGAVLGSNCALPCLSDPETPFSGNIYSFPSLAVDGEGRAHVVWDRVQYSVRDTQGNWTPVYTLGDFGSTGSVDDIKSAIAVDAQNTVHVVVVGSDGLYYLRKPQGGGWAAAKNMGNGYYPSIAADSQGVVYVAYFQPGAGVVYKRRLASGTWESPVILVDAIGRTRVDVAVGPDSTVHFVYKPDDYLFYRSLLPGGTLTAQETVHQVYNMNNLFGSPQIAVDRDNRLHLLSDTGGFSERVYLTRPAGGAWSSPEPIYPDIVYAIDMAIDTHDGVHIVGSVETDTDVHYFYRSSGSGTFDHYIVPSNWQGLQDISLTIDRFNTTSLLWTDDYSLTFHTTANALQDGAVSLTQPVNVPAVMHKPTLAFMHALESQGDWSQSGFDVSITAGLTTTQVYTRSAVATWEHAWVDLSPWTGQAISVTFQLKQAAGEPYVRLHLDGISVGSWLTPLPLEVSPAILESGWGGSVLTITGENFISTPIVRLGNTTLTGVEWVDEGTLQATIPASLPAGVYSLWVVNPGGQEGVIPGGFKAGRFVYIPLGLR